MSRKFTQKKRNIRNKSPKPIILILAEGKNVTESQYFASFQKQYANYNIKILRAANITNPKGLYNSMKRHCDEYELDLNNGDMAFVVLDLDCSSEKSEIINDLIRTSDNIQFVISNPCFEVWFLLHYRYSTHSYLNSQEPVRELRSFISNYEKTLDVSSIIKDKTEKAIENSKRLDQYFKQIDDVWPSDKCNPMTDVYKVIEKILLLDDKKDNKEGDAKVKK